MDDFTKEIRRLARRVAAVYRRHTEPRAILLVGTGATGGADRFSDLEMLLYYDDVPREDTLAAARRELQGKNLKGTLSDEGYSERYDVGGIHCQLGHAIIGPWEREIARVVDDLELDAALVKELSGLFEGLPLHGDELVGQWRERAAYTERLQRAMIEKHWNFFPWWYYQEKLGLRDATIWRHDVLVQSAYNIAGVLAALNRVYFSTFEFKRVHRFVQLLPISPPNLYERLEALFQTNAEESTAELERLIADTQTLVAQHFRDLDLSITWGDKPRPPGSRESPRSPPNR
jgi:hypothetical protein